MNTKSKDQFDTYLCFGGFGEIVHEHRFHPVRKWRFDWFLPDQGACGIAFEYDGLMRGDPSHTSVTKVLRDSDKINEAQAMGIPVYRVNAKTIQNGEAFTLADRVLRRIDVRVEPVSACESEAA